MSNVWHGQQPSIRSDFCSKGETVLSCCQGLSHYLEHMLFMGSEKFPDENEYDAYLNNNGGSSNAYTELVGTYAAYTSNRPCQGQG